MNIAIVIFLFAFFCVIWVFVDDWIEGAADE